MILVKVFIKLTPGLYLTISNIAKHRNDIPNGLKFMQLVEKLRPQECPHLT